MFYKKRGIPEEGDIVLCTVKKILYHSVFVYMDEYFNKEAMVHISEIAPGRIRNLRDYVKEGKKLVCKVLRKYPDGKLDLSLRRVPVTARIRKNEEYKQEQKSESILESVGKPLKIDIKGMYEKAGFKIMEEYGGLFPCFQEIAVKGKEVLTELGIEDSYAEAITKLVKERIKPPEVLLAGKLDIQSYESNGIEIIKEIIVGLEDFAKKKGYDFRMSYITAPLYRFELKAEDYKTAEEALKAITKQMESLSKGKGCVAELKRDG
ncbi:MAG: translation initiation factor IF-2 subunit alpha [Candidatus Woesearchaeota archaeon]